MDGVFFSRVAEAKVKYDFEKRKHFRNYILFGLSTSPDMERFAAKELSNMNPTMTNIVQNVEIHTQKTFMNGLIDTLFRLIPIFGIVAPFIFNYRSITVTGDSAVMNIEGEK